MSARAWFAAALCLGLFACGEPSGPTTPAQTVAQPYDGPRPRNVLLVSLDTLRADRLGAYGYGRATSPNFDALAARGALFTRAVSQSSWTLPAHATLFTGLDPLRHGVVERKHKLGPELELLSERLADAGRATFAFTGGGFVLGTRGFDQGFERFKADMGSRQATKQGLGRWIGPALNEMDAAGERPWFGFLHCYATHCPYLPPEPYAGSFHDPAAEAFDLRGLCEEDFTSMQPTPAQVRHVVDGYDDCVRWVDAELGELVAELDRRDAWVDTLLVVVSDHGEELAEHGAIGHGRSLRPELLRVPLLFVGPGIAPGRYDDDAALVDVLPTVLALLGLDVPSGLDGRDLSPRLHGGAALPPRGHLAFAEGKAAQDRPAQQAWIEGERFLVREEGSGTLELYSLAAGDDPTRDLADARADEAAELAQRLERRVQELGRTEAEDVGDLPPEELKRLRELGYVGD